MQDPRIDELNSFAAALGVALPLPAAEICALEDAGHLVDLRTGEIQYNALEAALNTRWQLTPRGRERYNALHNGAGNRGELAPGEVAPTLTEDAGAVSVPCPDCGGAGRFPVTVLQNGQRFPVWGTCATCHGHGSLRGTPATEDAGEVHP